MVYMPLVSTKCSHNMMQDKQKLGELLVSTKCSRNMMQDKQKFFIASCLRAIHVGWMSSQSNIFRLVSRLQEEWSKLFLERLKLLHWFADFFHMTLFFIQCSRCH